MKKLLALLAVMLLPVAASAQAPLQIPRAAAAGGSGITVSGYGTARVAVKTVQFTAQARGVADEAGALAAMRAAGVEEPVLGPYGARISRGDSVLVRGIVRDVTHAKLDRIAAAAAVYVAAHPGTAVDNVVFNARLDDCAALEQTARAAALADARRKADAIAALAGVSIDGVASVNETAGCPAAPDSGYGPGPNQFDLGTLTSTIAVYEYVTFAISQGAGPARRRPL
ncbi:MAG TPA: SIMPL domain-containing protein [Candidatus Elarobacter sp.]|jgi:uncharacterized protein YggE